MHISLPKNTHETNKHIMKEILDAGRLFISKENYFNINQLPFNAHLLTLSNTETKSQNQIKVLNFIYIVTFVLILLFLGSKVFF